MRPFTHNFATHHDNLLALLLTRSFGGTLDFCCTLHAFSLD